MTVRMKAPDGRWFKVPESSVAEAKSMGYADEATVGFSEQTLQATGEAAARGLTMGLSDIAATFTGEATPRELKGRKEANPVASTLGEVGGAVVGAVVGGPVKAASQAGSAVGRLVAPAGAKFGTRMLGRAAAGATEGSLWGLAQVVDDSVLGETELTAEKLVAGMGGGAVAGAVANGMMGLVGEGVSALTTKATGGKALTQHLDDLANKAAVRSITPYRSALKAAGVVDDAEIQKLGQYGREKGIFATDIGKALTETPDDVVARAETARQAEGKSLEALLDGVDARGNAVNVTEFVKRAQADVVDPLLKNPVRQPDGEALQAILDRFSQRPVGTMTFKEAWGIKSDLLRKAKFGMEDFGRAAELKALEDVFEKSLVDQAGAVSPHFANSLKPILRDYRSARVLQDIAQKRVEQLAGNVQYGLRDTIWGAGLAGAVGGSAGGPAGVAAGLAGAVASKMAREHGMFITTAALSKLAKAGTVDKIAKGLKTFVDKGLASSPVWGGPFRGMLEQAAAQGATDLLAEHLNMARTNPDYVGTLGLEPGRAEDIPVFADRLAHFDALDAAVKERDKTFDAALGRFVGRTPGRAPRFNTLSPQEYKKRIDDIERTLNDQDELVRRLSPGDALSGHAPSLTAVVAMKSLDAARFLQEKAPKDPNTAILGAMQVPWEPSADQLAKWSRYLHAVEAPERVLNEMKDGVILPEYVETMKRVYPAMLEDLKVKMMERLATHGKQLPFHQKQAIQTLFGIEATGVGNPGHLKLAQKAHASTMKPAPKTDGRQDVDTSKNMQTQAQRIEGRGTV